MTDEDIDLKKSLIDGVNSILQIRLEELKYDEEKDLALNSRYSTVANNFKNKIFGSAAAVAIFLTALLPFVIAYGKGTNEYAFTILGFLMLDFALVGLTEYWFSQHVKRAGHLWIELDEKYALAIALVNRERVFLALRLDSIDMDQIRVFVPCVDVLLCQYRLEIINVIDKVSSHVRLLYYVKEGLAYLSDRQRRLICDAYKAYEANKRLFDKEADFLALLDSGENFEIILEVIKDKNQ